MDDIKSVPDEILREQCKYMTDVDLYNFLLMSKRSYRACKDILEQRPYLRSNDRNIERRRRLFRLKKNNPLWDYIQKNQDKKWNYYRLSRNPNITWDIVQNNKDIHWDYYQLSANPNITWDIV